MRSTRAWSPQATPRCRQAKPLALIIQGHAQQKESMNPPLALENELFGKRLREARQALRLSQRDLHAATGIAISMISGIENGTRNVSLQRASMLAKAVKIPLYKLLMP